MFLVLLTCGHRLLYFLLNSYGSGNCDDSNSNINKYNIRYMSLCLGDRPLRRSGSSFPTCVTDGHLDRVTYTVCCIATIDCSDDEHVVARNM